MPGKVRVRFAPSPTGGLHLGGIRTVLYNYLFARKHGGDFIVRIEDTDQSRFVPGAEQYIFECLKWCGLEPDESPFHGGKYGPYRQSERKSLYLHYALQLVKQGNAYYAFDTPEELEQMRHSFPQYDHRVRLNMKNSLSLNESETRELIENGTPYVIRIKMPEYEMVSFKDMIRGEVSFDTNLVDDKVLLKADGMPTYHLAVVVDDHLMEISHAFRGEEWLPSAPVHILLWKYLFGLDKMPEWAHLPLILGPDGKLSKRDAAKYGFPVFGMNWTDPKTGELTPGFKEKGFLPEAFINLLALLGWNDGSEQEIFTREELVDRFSMERVHSGGAHFDYEKAKWFNHEWIKQLEISDFRLRITGLLPIEIDTGKLDKIITLVKDRCTLLTDFVTQAGFFFNAPAEYDTASIKPKWNDEKKNFFNALVNEYEAVNDWQSAFLEDAFKKQAATCKLKPGELQLPFRIMLVGGKFGPPVFDIAEVLGKKETTDRISRALRYF
jgi:glutamyl-tRNA synthetase